MMKGGLVVLCVAALLAASECTKTKVAKSGSRFIPISRNDNPNSPNNRKLLQYVLKNTKCPSGNAPCKPLFYIESAQHTNELIFQKYQMRYIVLDTGYLRSKCDINFVTDDIQYFFKINHLWCYYSPYSA